ncbi:MAG: OsmC family protein [Rhodothermales bacterium]
MKVHLHRLDDAFRFQATNETGNELHFDITEEEGGTGLGVGPMQSVVMALGGCSSIDIISILKKGRQDLRNFDVVIDYERAEGEVPSLFTTIHVHYALTGDLDVAKVRRAVDLSMNKYCSVAKILEETATITSSFSINGIRYE